MDLLAHLRRQSAWSLKTFGPGTRQEGVLDHISKEVEEVRKEALGGPSKKLLNEWIDIAILAFDGAWRSGASPEEIVDALEAKQIKNEGRKWPDWRKADPNKAIEHDRSDEVIANDRLDGTGPGKAIINDIGEGC